jgi:2-dehydro-3-deoxyphosphogluconate aldolase / (4S)-4-hydroxy-2-oxoglutarate aldolase
MRTENELIDHIRMESLLPLFYHPDLNICVEACRMLYRAGFRVIEYSNRNDYAVRNFGALIKRRDHEMKGLFIAAGSIKTCKQAAAFIREGADIIISPIFDEKIYQVCKTENILWIPGCFTPNEIARAESAGISLIKLCPGSSIAADYVEAIKQVFPEIDFIITGSEEVPAGKEFSILRNSAEGIMSMIRKIKMNGPPDE